MKAEEKRFLQFLEWSDKSFVIPVYQRNYDWKQEQCKQLFDDIIQITKEDYRTHFMWTIVAYNEDWYGKELLIIDWQQRLTTLSILLLSIFKVLSDNEIVSETIIKEKIYDEFLINKWSKDKTKKIRLKPVKDDREAFNSIFEWDKKEDSNVTINFHYFYNRLKEQEVSIDSFYKAIEQLIIVEILLKKWEDDPQLIFESLNSTWLNLTEADKVRNYILMKENTDRQEILYRDYWYKIEQNTSFLVSDFLRDYLTLKERKIPNKAKVYLIFKDFTQRKEIEVEDLLSELLKYSEYYKIIINSVDEDWEISNVIKRINKLETIVAYPFLLDLYSKLDSGIIDKEILLQVLLTIESFVFRRFVCDVPTNALNKIFMLLGKDIDLHEWYEDDYLNIFNYTLLNKSWSQRFPTNKEFTKSLLTKNVYQTQSRNKLHLLERLENFDNRESDIQRLIEDGILTIEHIMPQTLTPEWVNSLWEDAKNIQEKYLHTIWNITLTWYNSKMSNKSFQEKRSMDKWFNESRLFLNNYLTSIDTWNEETILKRYNILKDKSIKIWKFPTSTYKIKKDETKIFTLSDEATFTWTTILEFNFDDKEYQVNSWATFYESIIKILYTRDPILMKSFVDDWYLSTKFLSNDDNSWILAKIDEWLYVKIWINTEAKLYALRIIFSKFDIDLDDLSFYIK